ncbi:MAG: glycosyltransferase [Saprospiraceae bacterium]|nr:glycosyltransferase [Saprospiraceae bacterium]
MSLSTNHFYNTTLLITHYNRSRSLERLLATLKVMDVRFGEIIVSDDCSKNEHQNYLKYLQHQYKFRLVTTPINKGLANNLNKGQDAVRTPYTLYIQEDFAPQPSFPEKLADALSIMNQREDIDIARFYAYFNYPLLKNLKYGFSEMKFSIWKPGYKKFYAYSDHPHLRRSNFLQKFGRYKEGIKSDRTEYLMMFSFLLNGGKGIFYNDFQSLFIQENSSTEPSTVHRNYWRTTHNPIVKFIRNTYRHIRFNLDYLTLQFPNPSH